MIFRKV